MQRNDISGQIKQDGMGQDGPQQLDILDPPGDSTEKECQGHGGGHRKLCSLRHTILVSREGRRGASENRAETPPRLPHTSPRLFKR